MLKPQRWSTSMTSLIRIIFGRKTIGWFLDKTWSDHFWSEMIGSCFEYKIIKLILFKNVHISEFILIIHSLWSIELHKCFTDLKQWFVSDHIGHDLFRLYFKNLHYTLLCFGVKVFKSIVSSPTPYIFCSLFLPSSIPSASCDSYFSFQFDSLKNLLQIPLCLHRY